MSRNAIVGVLTLCLTLVCGCWAQSAGVDYRQQNQQRPQVLAREDEYIPMTDMGLQDNFEWQLLRELSSVSKGNTIISPISLKVLLALLYEGAAGNTASDLKIVFEMKNQTEVRAIYSKKLDSLTEGKPRGCYQQDKTKNSRRLAGSAQEAYTLNIGTKIFLDEGFQVLQPFETKACQHYQTAIAPTNFSNPEKASKVINDYVHRLTNGKIAQIVDADGISNSMMVLVNALYFRGYWINQFPKEKSHRGGFYLTPGRTVQVDYMATTEYYFYVESVSLDAKIIRIPYKGKKFAMIVVLPNAKAGLDSLLQQINVNKLRSEIVRMERRSVDLVLPKFAFKYQARMSNVLRNMGLRSLFDNEASLPGIVRGDKVALLVSDVLQKAGIEVNEEGSTASASTAIEIGNKFGDAQAMFNATHPFLFYIEDQVGPSILFLGTVTNPLEQESQPLPPRFADDSLGVAPTEAYQPAMQHNTKVPPPPPQYDQRPIEQSLPALVPPPPSSQSSASSIYSQDDESVKKRFNYVDLELLQALVSSTSSDNIFVSPASVKSTLGMILEGAKGASAVELANVLRLPHEPQYFRDQLKQLLYDISAQTAYTTLQSANGIFVSDKLQVFGSYKTIMRDYYNVQVQPLDFDNVDASTRFINQWVSSVTKNLIPSIVGTENINRDTSVLLANAMYFKSIWKYSFDPMQTAPQCFYLQSGECQKTLMMHNTADLRYKMVGDINAHALEIPYNDDYAMLVLMPVPKHSIAAMLRDLQHVTFNAIIDKLEKTEVEYAIPQFDIDYAVPLRNTLQTLGIRAIFGANADLSGIVQNERVRVDNIVHKAKIEVNEQGTIAAAATAAVVIPLMGSTVPIVETNRPFAFFIYKMDNRNIIFEGIVNRPKKASATPSAQSQFGPAPVQQNTGHRSQFAQRGTKNSFNTPRQIRN